MMQLHGTKNHEKNQHFELINSEHKNWNRACKQNAAWAEVEMGSKAARIGTHLNDEDEDIRKLRQSGFLLLYVIDLVKIKDHPKNLAALLSRSSSPGSNSS